MKFLRQLFGRDSNPAILAAPVNGELCQVLTAQAIGSNAQLHVETGQNALVFNGERRSSIYPTGEHPLEAQDMRGIVDGGEANILFLQIAPPVKRAWQTIYRPDNKQPLILSGHYTAAIDDTRLLVAALLDGGNMPDSRTIDGWLHQYIRKILTPAPTCTTTTSAAPPRMRRQARPTMACTWWAPALRSWCARSAARTGRKSPSARWRAHARAAPRQSWTRPPSKSW